MAGLDTSGAIQMSADPHDFKLWSDLNPFTQGYVEALLTDSPERRILSPDQFELRCWVPLGFSDLAPETLARIMEDCERWRAEFTGGVRETSANRADMGREFWRIRQEGRRQTFPPLTPYLGDGGKVYLRDAPSPSSDRGGS